MTIKSFTRNPAVLVVLFALALPFVVPLAFLLFPLALALAGFYYLSIYNASCGGVPEIQMNAISQATAATAAAADKTPYEIEQPVAITAKASSQPIASSLLHSYLDSPTKSNAEASNSAIAKANASTSTTSTTTTTKTKTSSSSSTGGAAILAKLKAQKAARAAAEHQEQQSKPKPKPLTILYASQLGTAAEIAKTIHADAQSRGLPSHLASMNEFGFDNVCADKTPVVIMVASSTGDGDAPDNAAKFYAAVKRKTNPPDRLQGVAFTILGLGDSNYTRYMAVSRALKSRFLDLGATAFYDPAEADDVDGLEEVVEAWMYGSGDGSGGGLWKQVVATCVGSGTGTSNARDTTTTATTTNEGIPPLPKQRFRVELESGSSTPPASITPSTTTTTTEYSAENPFWAPVLNAKYLSNTIKLPKEEAEADDERTVIHVELDISGSGGLDYQPGDSIGVCPENDPALVDALLQRIGVAPDDVITAIVALSDQELEDTSAAERPLSHLKWPCTVRAAFSRGVDLTSPPRKSLLRSLAEHCTDPQHARQLLHLSSRQGRDDYMRDIVHDRPSVVDLLHRFPTCHPPLPVLLDALPPLPPRAYSIACSPLECPHSVCVAFTVVKYNTKFGERQGVATGWLHRLLFDGTGSSSSENAKNQKIPLFVRRGGDFRPPTDLSVPWILIGPGTGVAPFRGFLQHRRHQLKAIQSSIDGNKPCCWLFFGCRRPNQDYLYEEDWNTFLNDGTLTELEVAFSRQSENKEKKVYVQHLMAARAQELHNLIVNRRGYVFVCGDGAAMAKDVHETLAGIVGGSEVLAAMAKEGRYVRDIWS